MKLRIKGNSLRLRLSKTDVQQLADTGRVSDKIFFGIEQLTYSLKCSDTLEQPEASFGLNHIVVSIPAAFAAKWPANNTVGIDAVQNTGNGELLSLLIEKDFQCLDETTEDQSDNYINPNSTC